MTTSARSRTFYSAPSQQARMWKWLSTVGNREWHLLVQHYNWDNGIAPLFWIAERPECDRATAVDILVLTDPYDIDELRRLAVSAGPKSLEQDALALVEMVAENLARKFYPSTEIRSDMWSDQVQSFFAASSTASALFAPLCNIELATQLARGERVSSKNYSAQFQAEFWDLVSS